MRRRLAAVVLASTLLTQASCFGPFRLTVGIWEFNRGASSSKWVQELLFLGLIIIPVYEVASFVDAILFNSIEFWGGRNPVASGDGEAEPTRMVALPDGLTMAIVREGADSIRIEREGLVRHFQRTSDGFVATDENGAVVATVAEGLNGEVLVYDAEGRVRTYSPDELAQAGSSPLSIASWSAAQVPAH